MLVPWRVHTYIPTFLCFLGGIPTVAVMTSEKDGFDSFTQPSTWSFKIQWMEGQVRHKHLGKYRPECSTSETTRFHVKNGSLVQVPGSLHIWNNSYPYSLPKSSKYGNSLKMESYPRFHRRIPSTRWICHVFFSVKKLNDLFRHFPPLLHQGTYRISEE